MNYVTKDRLLELEDSAIELNNMAVDQQRQGLRCTVHGVGRIQCEGSESTAMASNIRVTDFPKFRRQLIADNSTRQKLLWRTLSNVETISDQWDTDESKEDEAQITNTRSVGKTSPSYDEALPQIPKGQRRPSFQHIVRTGEWPFEPGSEVKKQRQSYYVDSGVMVEETNEFRNVPDYAYDPGKTFKASDRLNGL